MKSFVIREGFTVEYLGRNDVKKGLREEEVSKKNDILLTLKYECTLSYIIV